MDSVQTLSQCAPAARVRRRATPFDVSGHPLIVNKNLLLAREEPRSVHCDPSRRSGRREQNTRAGGFDSREQRRCISRKLPISPFSDISFLAAVLSALFSSPFFTAFFFSLSFFLSPLTLFETQIEYNFDRTGGEKSLALLSIIGCRLSIFRVPSDKTRNHRVRVSRARRAKPGRGNNSETPRPHRDLSVVPKYSAVNNFQDKVEERKREREEGKESDGLSFRPPLLERTESKKCITACVYDDNIATRASV